VIQIKERKSAAFGYRGGLLFEHGIARNCSLFCIRRILHDHLNARDTLIRFAASDRVYSENSSRRWIGNCDRESKHTSHFFFFVCLSLIP